MLVTVFDYCVILARVVVGHKFASYPGRTLDGLGQSILYRYYSNVTEVLQRTYQATCTKQKQHSLIAGGIRRHRVNNFPDCADYPTL